MYLQEPDNFGSGFATSQGHNMTLDALIKEASLVLVGLGNSYEMR